MQWSTAEILHGYPTHGPPGPCSPRSGGQRSRPQGDPTHRIDAVILGHEGHIYKASHHRGGAHLWGSPGGMRGHEGTWGACWGQGEPMRGHGAHKGTWDPNRGHKGTWGDTRGQGSTRRDWGTSKGRGGMWGDHEGTGENLKAQEGAWGGVHRSTRGDVRGHGVTQGDMGGHGDMGSCEGTCWGHGDPQKNTGGPLRCRGGGVHVGPRPRSR